MTGIMNRALKKAKATEKMKKEVIEVLVKSMEDKEKEKVALSDAITLRLRQYVEEKNALAEKANKEIEEFNVMYEEYEAICKNLGLSPETVWADGKEQEHEM